MQSTNHNSKQINAADGKREKIQSTNHKYRRPKAREKSCKHVINGMRRRKSRTVDGFAKTFSSIKMRFNNTVWYTGLTATCLNNRHSTWTGLAVLLAASSLALCSHPAAASAGVSAAFFGFPDKGGNPVVWGVSKRLVSCAGDFVLEGEGFGTGLLSTGEVLAACLLSTTGGLAEGWAVDCLTSSRNFSASAVCCFCASSEIWRAFSNSSCSFFAISFSLKRKKK